MAGATLESYAALGDSFTVGAGCPPGTAWADRLAEALRRRNPGLVYRNLASDGATSAEVATQLEPAMEMDPDLVTLICGVNDVLQSVRPDIRAYGDRLDFILGRLKASAREPLVLTATAPENLSFLDLGPRTTRRVRSGLRRLNEETRRHAQAHGVVCLEVAGHPGLDDPENFQADGLHPSQLGHMRAAAIFERLLSKQVRIEDGVGSA
jgi:lysophospholipase L1-like esterase